MIAGIGHNASATPTKVTGHRAGNEERHDQRVDRGHERSHPGVDDARCEKQLKRIGGNPEQVEEKRHGGIEAAKERHEPGQRQLGIARERHRRVSEPTREEDEAERQQLAGMREIERGRHNHLRQPARLIVARTQATQECLTGLHETRQHDEEIAGDERGDERVARLAEDIPDANRCERGDQSREHPQTDQQRDRRRTPRDRSADGPIARDPAFLRRWPQSRTVRTA